MTTLNKAVKAKLILAMVAAASKRQAAATNKACNKLEAIYRGAVEKMARAHLPEVKKERWAELLQNHMLVSHKAYGTPIVYEEKQGGKPGESSNVNFGGRFLKFPHGTPTADRWRSVMRAVKENWGGVFSRLDDNFSVTQHSNYTSTLTVHWNKQFADLPGFPGQNQIIFPGVNRSPEVTENQKTWEAIAMPLHLQACAISELVLKVVAEAVEYHEMLTQVFEGIRTIRQLEDQFPEALKFLPEDVYNTKSKELAPVELINRARKMLVEGIPD
ncbi:hypothetical protein uan_102 [Pseudomonas phage UAntarctica]|nr:hypothetical protein uan_102 [Pseudomonas phage UAntarctica]